MKVRALSGLAAVLGAVALSSCGCAWFRSAWVAPAPVAATRPVSRPPAPALPPVVRAVWVARFHYREPGDIALIMRNCASLGFNTVLFQVRGNGTVAYRSQIEPWLEEYDFLDPGYDPLAIAVQEAHRHGLRIEAWMNIMPGWRGPKPPAARNQLYHTHPEWFLHDAAGQRQPLATKDPQTGRTESFYVILNPCLPEVRQYLAALADEVARNYEVDGVHMDYVRYAWDTTPRARELYPRDPVTLGLYREQVGLAPDENPALWDRWRADQLTLLVRDVRIAVDRARPGTALTAAVWSSPESGYRDYFQNAVGWLRVGLVDAVYPMAYTDDARRFAQFIAAYEQGAPGKRIVPGIGIYKHETPEAVAAQVDFCARRGGDLAVFSYESIHAVHADRRSGTAEKVRATREMRRAVLGQGLAPRPGS